MAYREVHCVEIREIVGCWQAGLSQRRIARGTGLSCESPGSIDQQTARSPGSMCHFAKVIEPPLRGV